MPKEDVLLLALLALITFGVYSNGLTGEFLYDDQPYITKNPQVIEGAPIFTTSTPPDKPYLGLYRPVFVLSLRLNYWMAGLKPSVFHGTNLFLHYLVSLSFFLLLRFMVRDRACAFLGALLFAVHPIHVETVTWIVGRAELLACLFCLLGAIIHLSAREKPHLRILEALFFVLAVLSKENALVLPFVLWLVEYFGSPAKKKTEWRYLLKSYGFYIPLMAGILTIRYVVLHRFSPDMLTAPFQKIGFLGRLEAAFSCTADYLKLLIAPHPLKIFYHLSEIQTLTFVRLLFLLLFCIVVLWAFKKGGWISGWLLWIPVALLPVLNLVPIGAVFAERFLYLPSIGACAALSFLWIALFRMERAKRGTHLTLWMPVAMVLIFGILTYIRNPVFDNSFNLWKDAVQKGEEFAFPHYNLGECYFEEGIMEFESPETQGAVKEFKTSLQLNPRHPYSFAAHYRLGQYYFFGRYRNPKYQTPGRREDLSQAVYHLKEAIEKGPPVPEKWRAALLLAEISLIPQGEKFVSLEQGQEYLMLAEALEAPEIETARIRAEMEAKRAEAEDPQ